VSGTLDIDGAPETAQAAAVSLAEALVALAVTGLLLAGTFTLLDQGVRVHAWSAARVEAQQAARVALERLASELRQAGFGPAGTSFPAIAVAEPTRLVLQVDLDGDGRAAGSREVVTWLLGGGGVLRRNAGAGAQPVINGVRELRFTYRDAAGQPTVDPGAVRSITIALTTEPAHPARDAGRRAAATLTTVRLRNR
jgi:Tfp pilus assembly protein PilW